MRVSMQCSRGGSARHNDRTFDLDKAKHIDQQRTQQNIYYGKDETSDFETKERMFYEQHYGRDLCRKNQMYINQRHPERCKTIDNLLTDKQTRPEEMILQIGNAELTCCDDDFMNCVRAYLGKLNKWNQEHGNHMHLLNMAVHFDETTPHAHIRRVWDYQDEKGYTRIGQEKALQQAGVELPDPSKPVGRYNNRKITFDRMARELWQETVIEYGFEIETQPLPRRPHMKKADYIAEQVQSADETIQDITNMLSNIISEQNTALDRADIRALDGIDGVLSRVEGVLRDECTSMGIEAPERLETPQMDYERY